jgi:hypothetical protein
MEEAVKAKFLDKSTREEMVDELVDMNVECLMDDCEWIEMVLRDGTKGYCDDTDDSVMEQYEHFCYDPEDDDHHNESNKLYKKALAEREIYKMLKSKRGKKK